MHDNCGNQKASLHSIVSTNTRIGITYCLFEKDKSSRGGASKTGLLVKTKSIRERDKTADFKLDTIADFRNRTKLTILNQYKIADCLKLSMRKISSQ